MVKLEKKESRRTCQQPTCQKRDGGQSNAECPTKHGLLEPTAEVEESIPSAVLSVHYVIGMHVSHPIYQ